MDIVAAFAFGFMIGIVFSFVIGLLVELDDSFPS